MNWFALYAKLLRSFFVALKLGIGRERSAQGAKQFMKSTPELNFIKTKSRHLKCQILAFERQIPIFTISNFMKLLLEYYCKEVTLNYQKDAFNMLKSNV